MGANNTITTASSSSSGAPRRPMVFFKLEIFVIETSLLCSTYAVKPAAGQKQGPLDTIMDRLKAFVNRRLRSKCVLHFVCLSKYYSKLADCLRRFATLICETAISQMCQMILALPWHLSVVQSPTCMHPVFTCKHLTLLVCNVQSAVSIIPLYNQNII